MHANIEVWDTTVERRRLENLQEARRTIRRAKHHQILTDYIPGHVWYNWAEYPAERCPMPTEADEKNFAFYREKGMGLIKIHEEWNDALEIYGTDKFRPTNDEGFRKLIDMAHRNKLKFLPYISSGYFDRRSRYYDPKWATHFRGDACMLEEAYFQYVVCSPRSPEWRAFLLNQVERMFDTYAIDGLYNDVGTVPMAFLDSPKPEQGHVDAFEESPQMDGAFEDLIQEIYSIVHRNQGIFTLHHYKYANPSI